MFFQTISIKLYHYRCLLIPMSSTKNEILSLAIDNYMCDSFTPSQIKTVCDRKAADSTHSTHKLPSKQCGTSNKSNRSKYSNSGKLTKSNFYETLRKGIKQSQFRKEEETDIQINLLVSSLQIQMKEEEELKQSMRSLFCQFSQISFKMGAQLHKRAY